MQSNVEDKLFLPPYALLTDQKIDARTPKQKHI